VSCPHQGNLYLFCMYTAFQCKPRKKEDKKERKKKHCYTGEEYQVQEKETVFFLLLRGPGIDFKELIPPAYVALRAGTTTSIV
jgi:hypothetical protein